MRALTAEAMRAGAFGFSTSRTLNHRTVKGDPTPSLRASEDELLGIALGMKDAGSGVIEFISDFNTPNPESEFEMIDRLLAAQSGRPFSVSLAQAHSRPEGWRRLLGLVERLVADGHARQGAGGAAADRRAAGPAGKPYPVLDVPSYKAIADKSVAERLAIMRDPAFRAKLLAEARRAVALRHGGAAHRLRPHVPARRSAGLRAGRRKARSAPRPRREGRASARGGLRLS